MGQTALASSALGITIFFFCWLIGAGPVAAVAPMVAHILGALPHDRANVRGVVRMGFWAVVIVSLPLIVLLLFTHPVMLFLGQRPELAAGAGRFTAALCIGLPFSLFYQGPAHFSTALGRPHAALVVMVFGIAFNFAGDYMLIFGHFGCPKLGLVGAAISSAASYTFQFFALLAIVFLTPKLKPLPIFRRFFRPRLGETRGSVPSGHADRADDDVRGEAVQHGDADDGHIRRRNRRRRIRSR